MQHAFLMGLAALLVLSGCSGPSTARRTDASATEQELRAAATDWEGTPHRWGGTTRRGIDCSGLVQVVFADLFDHALPRTTREQATQGKRVRSSRRAPGDLIFFKTAPKTRHVGIYLGGGEFVHASSSNGVTVSPLDGQYWQRTYWMTRRVLDRAPPPATPIPSPATDRTPGIRTGW